MPFIGQSSEAPWRHHLGTPMGRCCLPQAAVSCEVRIVCEARRLVDSCSGLPRHGSCKTWSRHCCASVLMERVPEARGCWRICLHTACRCPACAAVLIQLSMRSRGLQLFITVNKTLSAQPLSSHASHCSIPYGAAMHAFIHSQLKAMATSAWC